MKTKKLVFYVDLLFLSIMTLCSLFYTFANFSKSISGQLGFAQLIFSIITIFIFVYLNRTEKVGLPIIFYLFYLIAQLVPIFFWIVYIDVNFIVFPKIVAASWFFIPIHLILIVWSIIIIMIKKRLKQLKFVK